MVARMNFYKIIEEDLRSQNRAKLFITLMIGLKINDVYKAIEN